MGMMSGLPFRSLVRRIVARMETEYRTKGSRWFVPSQFSDLGEQEEVLKAFSTLRTRKTITPYVGIICECGRIGDSMPAANYQEEGTYACKLDNEELPPPHALSFRVHLTDEHVEDLQDPKARAAETPPRPLGRRTLPFRRLLHL